MENIEERNETISGVAPAPSAHDVRLPYKHLVYVEDGPVARLTLNRPHARNALSIRLSDELIHALEHVRDSTTLKVLVIQGAGGTFCAGDDITEMFRWGNANEIMRRVAGYQHMADTLEYLDKITIARVDGYAVGGGLEITMACDFVVAAAQYGWACPRSTLASRRVGAAPPGWRG